MPLTSTVPVVTVPRGCVSDVLEEAHPPARVTGSAMIVHVRMYARTFNFQIVARGDVIDLL